MGRLQGKVAIVTGGASGMGLAHVFRLREEGARVVISDKIGLSDTVLSELAGEAIYVSHDVTSEQAWVTVVEKTLSKFGRIDILVNNAGTHTKGSFSEENADKLRNVLDVNVVGAWLGIQKVAPVMARRGTGSIINLSSIAAVRGMANLSVYGCSKGALSSLTRHAAVELGGMGIRVNAILPGAIDGTGMYSRGGSVELDRAILDSTPLNRVGRPEDISAMVAFLASNESRFVTGTEQVMDGGRSV